MSEFDQDDLRNIEELSRDIHRDLKSYREYVSEFLHGVRAIDGGWEIEPDARWKDDLDKIDAMLSILPDENDPFDRYPMITMSKM